MNQGGKNPGGFVYSHGALIAVDKKNRERDNDKLSILSNATEIEIPRSSSIDYGNVKGVRDTEIRKYMAMLS